MALIPSYNSCYRIWRQGQVLQLPGGAEKVERRRRPDGGAQEDVQRLPRSEMSFANEEKSQKKSFSE